MALTNEVDYDLTVTTKEQAAAEQLSDSFPILIALRERIEWRIKHEWKPGTAIKVTLDAPEMLLRQKVKKMYVEAGWEVEILANSLTLR